MVNASRSGKTVGNYSKLVLCKAKICAELKLPVWVLH